MTTMKINAGLDTGDMLLKWETPIGSDETSIDIAPRLAEHGAALLIETLEKIETIEPIKQNDADATLAPILKKEDGLIDFGLPANEIFNRIRGFQPWPGVYTQLRGQRVSHLESAAVDVDRSAARHNCIRNTGACTSAAVAARRSSCSRFNSRAVSTDACSGIDLNGFTLTENEPLS